VVELSGSLGPRPVKRINAVVLKQSEQARGLPLSGSAIPVADELFWIALSAEPDQVSRNLQLLGEGQWFDLPILFEGGTRALLTFEKGTSGQRIFQSVLSKWIGEDIQGAEQREIPPEWDQ
jgi:hypothetical protein